MFHLEKRWIHNCRPLLVVVLLWVWGFKRNAEKSLSGRWEGLKDPMMGAGKTKVAATDISIREETVWASGVLERCSAGIA